MLRVAPARPQLVVMPSASGQFVFQLQGQAGAAYYIERSSDLAPWTTVSTNTLSGATLNLTNSIAGALNFYRAVWAP